MQEKDEIKVPSFLRKKRLKKSVSKTKNKPALKKEKAKKNAKKRAKIKQKTKKKQPKKPAKKQASKSEQKPLRSPVPSGTGTNPKIKENKEKPQKSAGKVTHYFDQIKVAIILLEIPIKLGQELNFEGSNSFTHKLVSMQFNHQEIKSAKKGQEIGVKVKKPVKSGDIVYLEQ